MRGGRADESRKSPRFGTRRWRTRSRILRVGKVAHSTTQEGPPSEDLQQRRQSLAPRTSASTVHRLQYGPIAAVRAA